MTRQGQQPHESTRIPPLVGAVAEPRPARPSCVLSSGQHSFTSVPWQVEPDTSLLEHGRAPDSASPSVAVLIERMGSTTPEMESGDVFHGAVPGLFGHVNGEEADRYIAEDGPDHPVWVKICPNPIRPRREIMPYRTEVSDTDPPDLVEALGELQTVPIEADEMGFSQPETDTIRRAEKVLRQLYGVVPRRYFVYPMDPGDVAVGAPGSRGHSVVFYCFPDGSIHCYVNLQGDVTATVYRTTDEFPDLRVREALAKMERS